MKKILGTVLALAGCVTVMTASAQALAFGFRLGGQFAVDPESINLFAFGAQHDLTLVDDYFYFNSDATFAVGDEYFTIDIAPVGFRFAMPTLEGKLRPGFHVNFLLKDVIRYDPDSANGFGLGAVFGPSLAFHFPKGFEIFLDLDIAIYKFVQKESGLFDDPRHADPRQIQIGLMVGFRL